ncbi:MAG: hypothetical protein EU547_06675 [Promethearchaeota archaeon]|nr:MAG: hypothetical protein EU547_06675 [Candidatus Lokiarchaeota archaeon]
MSLNSQEHLVMNKVIKALLDAYLDILDHDGMNSILKEANMLEIREKSQQNPNRFVPFEFFNRILTAQNLLLYQSDLLLYNIGKKFSFYLFPFGKSFEESINELTELIKTDWRIEILSSTHNSIEIKVENCVLYNNFNNTIHLFEGFLVRTLEKTLSTEQQVHYKVIDKHNKNFRVFLRINNNSSKN